MKFHTRVLLFCLITTLVSLLPMIDGNALGDSERNSARIRLAELTRLASHKASDEDRRKIMTEVIGILDSSSAADREVIEEAAILVQRIAQKNPSIAAESCPQLMQKLEKSDSRAKCELIRALGSIGTRANSARGRLEAIKAEENGEYAQFYAIHAAVALARIAPSIYGESSTKSLISYLNDSRRWVRWNAADALGVLGVKSDEIRSALSKLLSDPDICVRVIAARAICRIGAPASDELIRVLVRGIQERGSAVYYKPPYLSESLPTSTTVAIQATALVGMGPKQLPNALKSALQGSLDDDDPEVRLLSISAIKAIALVDQPTIASLRRIVDQDKIPQIREAAKLCLAKLVSEKQ